MFVLPNANMQKNRNQFCKMSCLPKNLYIPYRSFMYGLYVVAASDGAALEVGAKKHYYKH